MQDYKTMISMCAEQEEKFQFEHFSREDALKIGLKLHENAKEQPVAVEITVNGLVVFRYFAEGAKPDSERLFSPDEPQRRRRTVCTSSRCNEVLVEKIRCHSPHL